MTEHQRTHPITTEEQAAPVDWQAIARQRERELKTVGERKHAAEQELATAREALASASLRAARMGHATKQAAELAVRLEDAEAGITAAIRQRKAAEERARKAEAALEDAERLRLAHRALSTATVEAVERAEQAEAERDGAYRERAHLVALLAAMTDGAVIASAPDVDEPGWQIVYLTIGGRQASWHISPRDADLFQCVPHVDADHPKAQWDGHTTDDKYADIRQHTRALFHQCGPACAEGHTYTGRCARP